MRGSAGWQLGVGVVAAVAGLLFVSTARTAQGTDLRAERHTELADLIHVEQTAVDDALTRLERLRADVALLTRQDPDNQSLGEQVRALSAAAGLTAVQGPALVVRLDDAPIPADGIPDGYGGDDFIVHQQDLQAVVNALLAGGAEAVGVMDQRLMATSAVRCVGNTLILNGRVYAPPYTVTAVGPVDTMRASLDADPSVGVYRQWASLIGLGYDVVEHRLVRIPGYEGPRDLHHAEPAS